MNTIQRNLYDVNRETWTMLQPNIRMTIMEEFGERLSQKLAQVGLSVRQAALQSGVDYPFLSKIVSGKKSASLDVLNRLQTIPSLRDFAAREKVERMMREYDTDSVISGALKLLDENPERVPKIKLLMREISDQK